MNIRVSITIIIQRYIINSIPEVSNADLFPILLRSLKNVRNNIVDIARVIVKNIHSLVVNTVKSMIMSLVM